MSEHDEDEKREHDDESASDRPDPDDRTLEDSKSRPMAAAPSPRSKSDGPPSVAAADEVVTSVVSNAKPEDKKRKLLNNLVFVVGFLATLVVGYYVGQWLRVKFGEPPAASAERYRVGLRGDEPQLGPDDALVTIIEFADFQCKFCIESVEPLEDAMADYEGDVRLIFKHYPLGGHAGAAPAAHVSWAAHQQGHFWEFHHRLFAAKGSIKQVPEWVAEFGLDAEKFGGDMESKEAKRAIDSDMFAGGQVGVTGTPAFFVNGRLYRGKQTEVGWRKIIEVELAYAKELVDDGVARADVYEHLMESALDRQPGAPEGKSKVDPSTYKVPITGRPVKGPATALVTVVEFADYHCPHCSRMTGDLDRLLEKYPNDVRLVYVQRPLAMHPNARDASKAAFAAERQGKFWEMHDELFLRQLHNLDQFVKVAEKIGLDVEQFKADYASEEVAAKVAEDQKLADQLGVNGTPAFFINGRHLPGAQGFAAWEPVVLEELEEAKALVASGTAPSEVYELVIADGKTSLPPKR
jgi:protein-disulfide isomerase